MNDLSFDLAIEDVGSHGAGEHLPQLDAASSVPMPTNPDERKVSPL
ncbi:hypothetical protein [Microvirga vignae]|nr:hypothetical protein [Microvirga vignae]